MKRSTFILLLTMATAICHAQDELSVLSADRPGYTWGAAVLPHHKVSWENGFGYESSPDGKHTWTLNSTIVRYGIFKNVELRVGTDFLLFDEGDGTKPTFAVAPLTIGTKLKVYESSSWLPSVGLLVEFKSPHIGSKELLPAHLAPSTYLLFEHEITDWMWLCYNAGLVWDGEAAEPQKYLSLAVGFNITDQLGAFAETYHYLHSMENTHMTEFGLTWMVNRRLQFDLEFDLDLTHFGKGYAIGGGVAWMIN